MPSAAAPPPSSTASPSSAGAASSSSLSTLDLEKFLQKSFATLNQNIIELAKQVVEGKEKIDKLQKEIASTSSFDKLPAKRRRFEAENEDEDEDEAAKHPPESVRAPSARTRHVVMWSGWGSRVLGRLLRVPCALADPCVLFAGLRRTRSSVRTWRELGGAVPLSLSPV